MKARDTATRPRFGSNLPLEVWFAVAVLAISLIVELDVRTGVLRIGYALERERETGERLRAERDRLALEQTVLGSTEHLAERASEMGMRRARPEDFVSLTLAEDAR